MVAATRDQQHRAEPEHRDRHERERYDEQQVVGGAAAIRGGDRAHRDSENQRQRHRGAGQQRGRGKAIGDKRRHVLAADVRAAEVAVNRAIEVARVLDVERLVETQLGADRCERLRIGLRPGHRDRGIGGNDERDRERDDRSSDQDGGAKDDSPYEVSEHRSARDDSASGKLAAKLEFGAIAMASSAGAVFGRNRVRREPRARASRSPPTFRRTTARRQHCGKRLI